ncbi:MAG: HAMP domain-containing histidine kinase [Nitrosomonas sp.]|nr:HAMP domain-containing histidine kinase [Nitrosomonas sp.]
MVFGFILAILVGLSFYIALESFEENILDDILKSELKHFQEQIGDEQSQGKFHSSSTNIFVTHVNEQLSLPTHLRDLSAGIHEINYANQNYRIFVALKGDTRYIIQYNDTGIHYREQYLFRMLWVCCLAILMFAFAIGWNLAKQVIRPINQLSEQIITIRQSQKGSLDLSEFDNDGVGELANELSSYHRQLQELLNREKEFAYNVSHELRTPVTVISLAAQVLSEKSDLSVLDQERINRIQRAVTEVSELIDTFLMLAQIYDDKPNQSVLSCEVGEVIRNVIEQQRVWLGNKPIEVIFEENNPINLAAPVGVVNVLIANLIRNAFRYTESGMVIITLLGHQLKIKDTGVGIDPSLVNQLFKHHKKINAMGMERVALGLSIVKRICERYGWSVSLDSTKGPGSTFIVSFNSDS